ncbi:MAG TPA: NAD(P)/FAD-dependent oxidoreductase [Pirellulales bacterium]|nr:NAD(P)/FAD-dependent oxidoreductase [Pirellulales bacterium]
MADQRDVAIVGGGAAGIAAARRLVDRKRSVLLIEALPRLGGRACSVTIGGVPLDFGCGWFHSAERNPLAALAQREGLLLDRRENAWQISVSNAMYSADERQRARAAYEEFIERLHSGPPVSDRAADVAIADEGWKPYINALSSFINGTELADLSVADFLVYDDAASDANWRIKSGYGAFIAGLGADLPSALSTRVASVSHDKAGFVLETDRGTIRAKAAIITVSTTMLATGKIRFSPSVDDHLQAAGCLPLGLADKFFLSVADPKSIPADCHVMGRLDRAETASYSLQPFGHPVIECYLGGACARALEEGGEPAAQAFAIGELRELFGADFVRGLTPLAFTRWGHEPSIGGSYSHALPGHANARAVLARPPSERLCFAGEACSSKDFSTAHGAWQSGLTAANWIEGSL